MRTPTVSETDRIACAHWQAGAPPDGGDYSAPSLTGLMLASGLGHAAFAKAIGVGTSTLRRWRSGLPMGRNSVVYRPSAAQWAGIMAMMAPKVAVPTRAAVAKHAEAIRGLE